MYITVKFKHNSHENMRKKQFLKFTSGEICEKKLFNILLRILAT